MNDIVLLLVEISHFWTLENVARRAFSLFSRHSTVDELSCWKQIIGLVAAQSEPNPARLELIVCEKRGRKGGGLKACQTRTQFVIFPKFDWKKGSGGKKKGE